ncbi:MAG TPA: hypothetical protein VFK48_08030 [Usitatibacter sp.]|nr:hypothetical protein [Usitatibacter sp.]
MNANDKQQGSRQQPDAGKKDSQQQQQAGQGQQYGEGNYEATRQYNEGLKKHMNQHDIEREALDAAPKSAAEEKDMEEAERVGRSKSRGEGTTPDGSDSPDLGKGQ